MCASTGAPLPSTISARSVSACAAKPRVSVSALAGLQTDTGITKAANRQAIAQIGRSGLPAHGLAIASSPEPSPGRGVRTRTRQLVRQDFTARASGQRGSR